MSEENKNVPQEQVVKKKVSIPSWAIRKISEKEYKVFVLRGNQKCFLATADTQSKAETLYWSDSNK
ncbi:MAG: hypothetical protein SH817_08600 [Leptospira sp.]|nr:hypothetical protein [Leptospira sp.]